MPLKYTQSQVDSLFYTPSLSCYENTNYHFVKYCKKQNKGHLSTPTDWLGVDGNYPSFFKLWVELLKNKKNLLKEGFKNKKKILQLIIWALTYETLHTTLYQGTMSHSYISIYIKMCIM